MLYSAVVLFKALSLHFEHGYEPPPALELSLHRTQVFNLTIAFASSQDVDISFGSNVKARLQWLLEIVHAVRSVPCSNEFICCKLRSAEMIFFFNGRA